MLEKNERDNDYIIINFKPNENNEEKVRIFGEYFVKNNKDKCHIEYNGKIHELKEYFEDIDEKYNHKDEIYFFLIGIDKINDMNHLFDNCNKLSKLLFLQENEFLKDMDKIGGTSSEISSFHFSSKSNSSSSSKSEKTDFYKDNISSKLKLSSIKKTQDSNDNIIEKPLKNSSLINSNVTNISYLFYNCNSLTSLPDITHFNTSNVKDMSYMFYGCNLLTSLPDISKWNTINVRNMSNIFGQCNSVIILPDISK